MRRERRAGGARLWLAALALLATSQAHAAQISLPLELDFPLLRDTLVRQIYTAPGPSARVLDDGHDCARLLLSDPRLDAATGRLRLRSAVHARFGTWLMERCTLPVDWEGEIEVLLEPRIDPGSASVRFAVVDSRVRRVDGSPTTISGVLWRWIKQAVHPQLSSFHVDLGQPLADLRAFLPLVLPEHESPQQQRLIDSVVLSGARVTPNGVVAGLAFDAPERTPAPDGAAPPEAPLREEEIARLTERIERWDSFLTFILKHAGRDATSSAVRNELLGVLLDAREELLDALAEPPAPAPDPVRALFLSTWSRLAPVLRRLDSTLPAERSLHYLSFVAAADALAALDRLGASVGVEISAAGLRRMARMLAPSDAPDPLAFDEAVDPELREIFEFGEPIELPTPEEGAEPALPGPGTSGSETARSRGSLTAMPLVRAAWTLAQRTVSPAERRRFRDWVPTANELGEYLPLVHAVLDEAAEKAAAKTRLETGFEPVYGWLVLAAAWKESCWRQLVLRAGRPVALRSSAGAVGILQVSPRVWRGFYDVRALEQDLPYNARAGAEILAHYLVDFAIPAEEHVRAGSLDALARATYAAYNGGPGALRRWRTPTTRADLRRIDDAFWGEYQAVKQTGEPNLASCWGS